MKEIRKTLAECFRKISPEPMWFGVSPGAPVDDVPEVKPRCDQRYRGACHSFDLLNDLDGRGCQLIEPTRTSVLYV